MVMKPTSCSLQGLEAALLKPPAEVCFDRELRLGNISNPSQHRSAAPGLGITDRRVSGLEAVLNDRGAAARGVSGVAVLHYTAASQGQALAETANRLQPLTNAVTDLAQVS